MTMPPTVLTKRINELRGISVAEATPVIASLYPHLQATAEDDRVEDDTAINLLLKAHRAIRPRAERANDRTEALDALRRSLDEGPRTPGRPAAGRPRAEGRTVRLYRDVDDEIAQLAAAQNITVNDMIARLVEEAVALRKNGRRG